MTTPDSLHIGIIGLGYVGLPLAVEFGKQLPTTGFDINEARVAELRGGHDHTLEVDADELASATFLKYSTTLADLESVNVYIVTVPTPIDQARRPDFGPLLSASRTVGRTLRKGDIVVFESTVYPGATEEVCVPVIERESGLKYNVDFFCGYSPERINPGDKQHRLPDIVKVTSGSTPEIADRVDALYRRVIRAGTHKASSIRVAEAAKVIENTQRDLNIALMNELSTLFEKLGIDTLDVLETAGTKWNFLPFRPGLVGGHCIGVDPYYLTHKAQQVGHAPEVILAGRRINDAMGDHVAQRVAKGLGRRGLLRPGTRVLVAGLSFKENCPDLRNTRVIDVVRGLEAYGLEVTVFDPCVAADQAWHEYRIRLHGTWPEGLFEAAILAVPHAPLVAAGAAAFRRRLVPGGLLFDVRGAFPRSDVDDRL